MCNGAGVGVGDTRHDKTGWDGGRVLGIAFEILAAMSANMYCYVFHESTRLFSFVPSSSGPIRSVVRGRETLCPEAVSGRPLPMSSQPVRTYWPIVLPFRRGRNVAPLRSLGDVCSDLHAFNQGRAVEGCRAVALVKWQEAPNRAYVHGCAYNEQPDYRYRGHRRCAKAQAPSHLSPRGQPED
jgi:hypothetical protein